MSYELVSRYLIPFRVFIYLTGQRNNIRASWWNLVYHCISDGHLEKVDLRKKPGGYRLCKLVAAGYEQPNQAKLSHHYIINILQYYCLMHMHHWRKKLCLKLLRWQEWLSRNVCWRKKMASVWIQIDPRFIVWGHDTTDELPSWCTGY